MTQQPFSRPGAVDLSGLQAQPAPTDAVSGAYTVQVTEANFSTLLESSMNAPVLLVFYSAARSPQSVQLADDLQTLSNEFEGRYLLGRVDVDQVPQIAQAVQVPSVPYVFLVAQGRPAPLLQAPAPLEELRPALTQVFQQLTASGFAGRHQPRSGGVDQDTGEELLDPRYAPAQDALERGDIDGAIEEYRKLLAANPADAEAEAGLAITTVLRRTAGVDLNEARAAAAAAPDDVDAQIMVADLDIVGGHVDDAFDRLIGVVRRTSEDDRERARNHLVELFKAVGGDDPRVLRARRDLASALF